MSVKQETLVVIGNGMVGHRFVEHVIEADRESKYRIVTFCEEPRPAYDRVGLTSFFSHRSAEKLQLARMEWYHANNVELHVGDRAVSIDRGTRTVQSNQGAKVPYDRVVLATGSAPFVPPIDGVEQEGVFVYRTIDDLERIIAYGEGKKRCAVIGGGLLGLEAAKAAYDLGLETHVVEFAPRLMPRQIDNDASAILVKQIENLGVQVHLQKATQAILGDGRVQGIRFNDETELELDMIIVSCGIRPRDELARQCGLDVGERGGVVVDDSLSTSDPSILAIGEVAVHRGMVYGLVAPGYEMAKVAAARLVEETATEEQSQTFAGADLSTKLKLMGVDVASFGDYETENEAISTLTFEDPFAGVYRKLFFDNEGPRLRGGILVGEASDFAMLSGLAKSQEPLSCEPRQLLGPASGAPVEEQGADALSDETQVCSCNNVSKGGIVAAIQDGAASVDCIKSCTKAGAGCGGCVPLVADILNAQLKKSGAEVKLQLCEHFDYSRQQLFDIIRIEQITSYQQLLERYGSGAGCEICKPAIASILASLWNGNVLGEGRDTLQDTNDRFLANIQRGGLYSVVPRVPGGEITPEKLIVLGKVAKKYGLYTKITGGQRVDLFGAQLHQLPEIWEELVEAGFESGHAYGKSVRTVKSCVGSTWCRYGVQDSVGFAVAVEERYRGIRAPHKIKFAVSGCVRECAEAQCKDVGLVATELGYNLYVCGNGGAKPRHADLLISDISEEEAIRYIDRFLMYYIYTADKLNRTSVWLGKLEGGIDHVRDVVINDSLGLCEQLEQQMQHLVDTYQCEWKAVVEDPEKRKLFRQFVNTDEHQGDIEFVDERGQQRPADWPRQSNTLYQIDGPENAAKGDGVRRAAGGQDSTRSEASNGKPNGKRPVARSVKPRWIRVGVTGDFPIDGGAAVKYGDVQIAVFRTTAGDWYATQNMCPHKNAFVLSRGIVGDASGVPKVACPLHKTPFSLETGKCLSNDELSLKVFPVRVEGDEVYLQLPEKGQLNAILGSERFRVRQSGSCTACLS